MYIVRQTEYEDAKREFFAKHQNDFNLETTGNSAEYYRKIYTFSDGASWYEVMMKVTKEVDVTVNCCNVRINIDFLQTEYWSSESNSKFYYEQWDPRK